MSDKKLLRAMEGKRHDSRPPYSRKFLTPETLCICTNPDACDHDFTGWRDFPDGNGGEQVCSKCGMGAMAYTLRTGV